MTNTDEIRAWYHANNLRNHLTPNQNTQLEHLKEECEAELTGHLDRDLTDELSYLIDQYSQTNHN